MKKTVLSFAVGLLIAPALFAQTLPQRTFVSAQRGLDANTAMNCSPTNPCRSFGAALTVTAPSGEVVALDSGGYGPVTISGSVSLIAPSGVYAGITVSSGTAITINGTGTERVALRGLSLNGSGTAVGVSASDLGVLLVEECRITGFLQGVNVSLRTSLAAVRSTFLANGRGIQASGTFARAAVGASTFNGNFVGVQALSGASVDIADSHLIGNGFGLSGYAGRVSCTRCLISEGTVGIEAAQPGGEARLTGSTLTGLDTAMQVHTSGVLYSLGDNAVTGNTVDLTGVKTPVAPQ